MESKSQKIRSKEWDWKEELRLQNLLYAIAHWIIPEGKEKERRKWN